MQIDSETGHEETIQPYLKDTFEKMGLHVIEDEASKNNRLGANNLICTLKVI